MSNIIGNTARRHRVPILSILRPKTAQRFLKRLRPEGKCLVFTGTKNKRGYGFVDVTYDSKAKRYPILTHRLAWALHYGADPDPELDVLHRCNNPKCCNVKHLYLGTPQDNADDTRRAGRHRSGMKGVKGVAHPASRYTQAQRDEVIALLLQGVADGDGLNFLHISRLKHVGRDTVARWWNEREQSAP